MSNARDYAQEGSLSPNQRLIAAHMHIIGGVSMHTISGSFGVNPGRVAEAINAVRLAIDEPVKTVRAYDQMEKSKLLSEGANTRGDQIVGEGH